MNLSAPSSGDNSSCQVKWSCKVSVVSPSYTLSSSIDKPFDCLIPEVKLDSESESWSWVLLSSASCVLSISWSAVATCSRLLRSDDLPS